MYTRWLDRFWWQYLFEPKDADVTWWRALICRIKGHPKGPIWYSSGLEPDMHCKGCGDELG